MFDDVDQDDDDPMRELSVRGAARRERILAAGLSLARKRRRRRQALRLVAAGVVVALGLRTGWPARFTRTATVPQTQAGSDAARIAVPIRVTTGLASAPVVLLPTHRPGYTPREIVITSVQTDSTLVDRLRTPAQPRTWRVVNDDELLRELAIGGRTAGLAWIDGRQTVLFPPDSRSESASFAPRRPVVPARRSNGPL